jgi:transposase
MRTPIFVRPLTDSEQHALTTGLCSPDAFTVRRCQILLAPARHERAPQIAAHVGCDDQTVRNAIYAFNRSGLDALLEGSSRPHRIAVAFDSVAAERLRALLHQSPCAFGEPTSLWTLDLAAAVCVAEGITDERVTGETIRATLKRLGVRWQRAKHWITSPDPAYTRKKATRPADPPGDDPSRLGARLRGRSLAESGRAATLGE